MADEQSGWKIGAVDVPADAAPANIGGGWTISSAPAEAAVAPAAAVPAPAPTNANAMQPEAGGFAPGPAKPPAVPMQYSQFGKRTDKEFDKEPIPEAFENPVAAASQAIGGGWRLIKAVAPNIGYTQLRGMGKPESELGPPPTTDARPAMNAASDVIEGAGNLVAPVALPLGLAAAPVETGLTLAGMYGASKGASAATEALGGSPEASRFAGDVAGALVAGGGGKLALGKMYEAAGSPEVKFGGTFPEAKAFADMSDQELIGHAKSIERDPPKNYAWQKEEIAKEVINRQNARALPGTAAQPPAPPEDLGGGWSLVRAKMAARSADVRGTPAAEPVVTPAAPVVTPADVTPAVTPPVTPPAVTPPPPSADRQAGMPVALSPNTAEVYTINGRKVNVRYDVREDGDLTNSFQDGYPQEYQPRDTNRIASAQRVAQRKNDMNGALMADSRLASDGAPVILDDGTVITRNHGTQALRELYAENRPLAQDYKQWITDHASDFGLDPEKVAGMDKPVLTRVLADAMKPEDVAAFAQEANMSSAARMSDAEVAQSLSKRMTGPLMDSFDPAEDGTPNAPFVRELIKGLPVEEQSVFMDAKGQISQTGARIIRNTIFAKAYPDQRALERMAESENASLKNITGGMLRAAPKVAQFQESVARGDRFDLGIGPEIADAAAALDRIAREKSTVADWKAQGDMFGRDPVVSRLVDIFAENRRSGKKIGDVLREYTEVANDAGDPKQDSMFGPPETPNKAEILEVAYERAKERWNPAQKDLFGDEATPAAAGGDGLAAQEGPGAGPDEGLAESRRQSPIEPGPGQESLVSPEAEAESRAVAKSAADKLLGAQLTAQMKSGMAARPEKLTPPPSRQDALFDNTPPPKPGKLAPMRDTGQGALFSKRIGGPAWRKGLSKAELAAEARAEQSEIGEERHPALHVNAQAMDLIHQAAGRRAGHGSDSLGTTFAPERMAHVARALHQDAEIAAHFGDAERSANLRRLADAVTDNIDDAGIRPSIVLQSGPGVTPAEYEGAAREELHHSIQLQGTGPKFGEHLDADKFLSSPEGQKATLALRKVYGQAGAPELAMEAGVRLMEKGRHGELGLTPEEAERLAVGYVKHLEARHGVEKVAEIAKKVDNAFRELREADASKSDDQVGPRDRQQQPQAGNESPPQGGRPGGGGGVSPADGLSGPEGDQDELFTGTPGEPHLDSRRPDVPRDAPQENRIARDESREAVQKALSDQSDKDFGAKLRTFVTGERDVRIAETNQLRGDLQRMVPNPVDQQAITLMRDFKHRPGELAEFVSGSHEAYAGMDPEERAAAVEAVQKLEPVIDRAQHPTPAMLEADRQMTAYFAAHLKEGKALGFLDSKWDNDEYITHIGMGGAQDAAAPGLAQRLFDFARGGGKAGVGPRGFKFAQKRDIPTVLHGVAYGRPPRTLNALDAMTIYGDQFARTAAAHLMMNALNDAGAATWGTFRGQKTGKVPADWVEMVPESPMFRKEVQFKGGDDQPDAAHKQLFVPEKIASAMAPMLSHDGARSVPGLAVARALQAAIKARQLGMSVFHIKALSLTGISNMGPQGVLKAFQNDMNSPEFEAQERAFVRVGGTTPILGRTMEAYHALTPTALPTGPEVLRSLPVIRWIDHAAQAVSELTFGVVQRKLKVTDFALQDAAWLAKYPGASGAEHFEAQRSIARQINATYGGLHWENLGINRLTLDLTRVVLLAPDWTYSNILNAQQAFEGGPGGKAARLFWIRSLILGLALTNGMSLLLSGRMAVDPTDVELGTDRKGGRVHLKNLYYAGAPGDASTLVHNVAKQGAVYGLARTVSNKLGPLAKTAIDLGSPRTKKSDGFLAKTWSGVKRTAEDLLPVPFAIPSIARMLRDQRGIYSMEDYVITALTGQTPTHDAPPKPSPEMRRLMGRKPK